MDVVRRNIQDLGGRISLKSERGKGMTIQLALPLTLAVMDGMVIKVGAKSTSCRCPRSWNVCVPARADVQPTEYARHAEIAGRAGAARPSQRSLRRAIEVPRISESVVIITEAGDGAKFGLVVDELCGHQQVVIKSIEESYGPVPGIAAATIFGNGTVAFILDVEKLSELSAEGMMPASAAQTAIAAIGNSDGNHPLATESEEITRQVPLR